MMWGVTWTTGSTHSALKSFDTTVDKQFAFDMAPSPGDKQGMILLHKSLDADKLLKAFHDGMLQSAYVEERQRLGRACCLRVLLIDSKWQPPLALVVCQ